MNVKKNIIFQVIYQLIIIGIPLIIAPHLTRTLGVTANGIYSYTYSIAYYFVIFANLGIQKYGIRLIASKKDDEENLRKNFWSLYFFHTICSLLCFLLYILYCLLIFKENINVSLVQSIFVISTIFDVTWLFYGLEKFKTLIFRNLLIKIIEVICIFLFVKDENSLVVYTFIMTCSVLLANVIMIPTTIKNIPFIKFSRKDVFKHIKPMFVLFLSVLAVSIYTMLDKTLLGALDSTDSVAIYEYSDKIVKIPLQFTSIIGLVLLPRITSLVAENKVTEIKSKINLALFFMFFIASPLCFGLISISSMVIPLYYGNDFIECISCVQFLSIIILIMAIGDIFRNLFIIPFGYDKLFTISLISSAVINLVLNLILIPLIGINGAIIGTIFAELFGLIIQSIFSIKKLGNFIEFIKGIPFVIFGIMMMVILLVLKKTIFAEISTVYVLVIEIFLGAIIYFLLSIPYILIFNKKYYKELRSFKK